MTSVGTSTVGSYKIELKYLCDQNGLAGPDMMANSLLRKPRQKGMELKGNLGHTVKPLPQKLEEEEGGRSGEKEEKVGHSVSRSAEPVEAQEDADHSGDRPRVTRLCQGQALHRGKQ